MLCFFHRFYEAPTKARHWIFGFIDFMFPKGNIPFIKPYLSPKIYKTLGKDNTLKSANYKLFLTKIIVLLFATFIENYYL